MDVKIIKGKSTGEQNVQVHKSVTSTGFLLICKGLSILLQWKDLVVATLTKWSNSTSWSDNWLFWNMSLLTRCNNTEHTKSSRKRSCQILRLSQSLDKTYSLLEIQDIKGKFWQYHEKAIRQIQNGGHFARQMDTSLQTVNVIF